MARVVSAEAELEDAATNFSDDDDDEDTEDGPVEGETSGNAYDKLERRLRKGMAKRLSAYQARAAERWEEFQSKQETKIQNRLDTFALTAGSISSVADPEAVRANIERQVAAHQAKMVALQEQLSKLGES